MTMTPVAMTIAGSDSSCGAGIQADLRMFAARGVYGATVITALTAQNPVEVTGVLGIAPEFVKAQAETVLQAFPIRAVKTGMLWSAETIDVVSDLIQTHSLKVIVDPVMIATSGAKLISDEAVDRYQHRLLPLATLATPNLDEASTLLGGQVIELYVTGGISLGSSGTSFLQDDTRITDNVSLQVSGDSTGYFNAYPNYYNASVIGNTIPWDPNCLDSNGDPRSIS